MAGNLRMDTSDFNTLATNIGTENGNIGACLDAIKKEIMNLGSTWSGDAYNAAKAKIEDFYTKTFVPYKDAVQGYIDFINQTKITYDNAEENLTTNANKIEVDAIGKFD